MSAELPVFSGLADEPGLLDGLDRVELKTGDVIISEGDKSDFFVIVESGSVAIDIGGESAGVAGSGSIVGELGIASGMRRRGTVTANAPTVVFTGGEAEFDRLLKHPVIGPRIRQSATKRLANSAKAVPVTLRDGSVAEVRPLVASDRFEVADSLREWSTEALARRFFTAAEPTSMLIDYLVDVDYVNHFAWGLFDKDGDALATVRCIRSATAHMEAEVAFEVNEGRRGAGIGTMLLGAIAAAADALGVEMLTAELLSENRAMKGVFDKADARYDLVDAGVLGAEMDVNAAAKLVQRDLFERLASSAAEIVGAAGIALVVPAEQSNV